MTELIIPGVDDTVDVNDPAEAMKVMMLLTGVLAWKVAVDLVRERPIELAARVVRILWWLLEHGENVVDVVAGAVG